MADLVSEENKVHALLHDAAESVVGDQVATWKNELTSASEDEILANIYINLGLEPIDPVSIKEIKDADLACRAAEATLLGHSNANHTHFAEIRTNLPDLYEKAIEVTRDRIAIYTPDFCIIETDKKARYYESSVIKELSKVVA